MERPVLWGFSDGANIAIEIALRQPDFARALVLHDPVVYFSEAYLSMIERLFGTFSPDHGPDLDSIARTRPAYIAELQRRHARQGPDHWRTLLPPMLRMWTTPLSFEAGTERDLARVVAPTLVVSGDRSMSNSLEETIAFYRQLPTAELLVLPGLDHERPPDPGPFVGLVVDFLARHPTD